MPRCCATPPAPPGGPRRDARSWTAEAVAEATGGTIAGDWVASGVSIDTRTLAPGDLFVALDGPNRDAHAFVAAALRARRRGGRGRAGCPRASPIPPACVLVGRHPGGAGRARPGRPAADHARGSPASPAASARPAPRRRCATSWPRQAPTHASAASHNNHWGVPLSLARLPEAASYGVFELGMNHAGEIRALTAQVRPHVALITTVAPAHLEFFASVEAIADAKSEIFEGLEPGGVAVAQPRQRALCPDARPRRAVAAPARIVTFGRHPAADWRLDELRLAPGAQRGRGGPRRPPLRLSPRHRRASIWSLNSLARAGRRRGAGRRRRAAAAGSLARSARRRPAAASGAGSPCRGGEAAAARRELQRQSGLDARGPGRARPDARPAHRRARRHAGAGASSRPTCMRRWPTPSSAAGVDLVFTCGPHMARLHDALPAARRGAHAADCGRPGAGCPGCAAARRRGAGQGLARQPHGAGGGGADASGAPALRGRRMRNAA